MSDNVDIRVVDLVRYFGKTRAVDGVSFGFSSGQVFGFIGPNGAGKTTTLRVLATLDEPTDGDAFMNGVSVKEEPEKTRVLTGYVPDSLPTHSDMTVHEYVDFFARAYSLCGSRRSKSVEYVEEFTGLSGLRNKLLRELSKGMKQRVSLARALVHDPAVLIMDEPAAGLDPRARVEFRELVSALADMGKAVLISSHILTELTEICDGVVIIERGRILETGTIEDVSSKQSSRTTMAVRALDGHDLIEKELLVCPGVVAARVAGDEVHFEVDGSDEICNEILGLLIGKGIKIVEFRRLRVDLEDIFMRVTRGEVQ